MLNSVGPPVSGERLASHCEYRPKVFATGTGIERAMRRVIGSAALIRYGVNSVVNAETATAIGYKKPLVTFSDNPSDAMMNENSPICDTVMPTRIAVRPSLPARKVPRPHETSLPKITATVMTTIGHA